MRRWLTNLIYLSAYALLLPIILFRRLVRGRPLGNVRQRGFGLLPRSSQDGKRTLWIQAVSVGEVNQLDALVQGLQSRHADWRIVISVTTATGMQLARKKFPALEIVWFPIDFSWAMASALRRLQPDLIVLTELELWPNLVALAEQREIPVVVINGRLSAHSFVRYQRFRWLVQPTFRRLHCILAQNETYAERFVRMGTPADRVHVTGSIKFDNALLQAERNARDPRRDSLRRQCGLADNATVWVAGSTQAGEEALVMRAYRKWHTQFPTLRLVVVPRHPHRAGEIAEEAHKLGLPTRLHSESSEECSRSASASPSTPEDLASTPPVWIVDTIGELGLFWALADIAFVGGSFGNRGGQNMLEPAAAGCAVAFGPNTWNFADIAEGLVQASGAVRLDEEAALFAFVQRALEQHDFRARLSAAARQFVKSGEGANALTVARLAEIVAHRDAGAAPLQAEQEVAA